MIAMYERVLMTVNYKSDRGSRYDSKRLIVLSDRTLWSQTLMSSLKCYCDGYCPDNKQNGTCELSNGGHCFSSVERVWDDDDKEFIPKWSFGCLPLNEQGFVQCFSPLVREIPGRNITCCNHTDLCNKNVFPVYTTEQTGRTLPSVALLITIITILLVFFIILIVSIILINNNRRENVSKPCNVKRQRVTALKRLSAPSSGSGSEFPRLIQRTIAMQLTFKQSLGKGRYGDVRLAHWRNDQVAVKIFHAVEEASWLREVQIYQTVLMRHDNVLGFIAADVLGAGSSKKMLLIMDYHKYGSLYDYLQVTVLDYNAFMTICLSILSGMVHLHTEIIGVQGKPAIAHRDIKSKNILVKNNGECAIADFGLAVRYSSLIKKTDIAPNKRVGTIRYMAPEVLNETLDMSSFDAFVKVDMYAVSLVLWEVCRRCITNNELHTVETYAIPYYDVVPSDPTFDQMRLVVCLKGDRPIIPMRWKSDKILVTLSKIMKKCWNENPTVRLTALQAKKMLLALY